MLYHASVAGYWAIQERNDTVASGQTLSVTSPYLLHALHRRDEVLCATCGDAHAAGRTFLRFLPLPSAPDRCKLERAFRL